MSSSFKFLVSLGFFVTQVLEPSAFGAQVSTKRSAKAVNLKPIAQGDSVLSKSLNLALQKSGIRTSEIGAWIGVPNEQAVQTLYASRAEEPMVPASLSKLVTAAAALKVLNPNFQFSTLLLAENPVADGQLKGPLYLQGGGDPSFVSENMWYLVNELTRSKVTQVNGDIIVDDSRFDAVRFDEDRESVRVDRAYDAPIGAMSLNWNSVNVFVRPGAEVGSPCQVVADPDIGYLDIKNETKTASGEDTKTISVERVTDKESNRDRLVVSGKLAIKHSEIVIYKNITQPAIWAGYALKEFLRERGIQVSGQIRQGAVPAKTQILARAPSKPLSQIVMDMAKFSNNYVAEMLVKNLAAESGEKPATMKTGLEIVRRTLIDLGLKPESVSFVNASGFTRENKLSAQQIGEILSAIRTDFSIYPEYLMALPIAGLDGTLKSRMKATMATGWVRAKTGLLNGAVGLAGFVGRPTGAPVQFAFIYNGSGREDKARALFDQWVNLVAAAGAE